MCCFDRITLHSAPLCSLRASSYVSQAILESWTLKWHKEQFIPTFDKSLEKSYVATVPQRWKSKAQADNHLQCQLMVSTFRT